MRLTQWSAVVTRSRVSRMPCRAAGAAGALVISILSPAVSWAQAADGERATLVRNVAVVDVRSGSVLRNQSILLRGGRIAAVAPSAALEEAPGARHLDATGLYAIPGLWDMHVHTAFPDQYSRLYIANGVTGVRDMGGDAAALDPVASTGFEQILDWRSRVEAGKLPGPRIVAARSIVDGPPGFWPAVRVVAAEDEVRELVREELAAGADFLKVYDGLGAREYRALADEARRVGLEIHGHLPSAISLEDAARAGQRTIEHLGLAGGRFLVMGSEGGARIANRYRAALSADVEIREVMRRWLEVIGDAATSQDPGRRRAVVEQLASSGIWQVPTWRTQRRMVLDPRLPPLESAPLEYVPPLVRRAWSEHPATVLAADSELATLSEPVLRESARLMQEMHAVGVRFLAGSDSTNPGLVPGFALHDELEDLVGEAGFTPLEALRMATLRPAEFLRRDEELGAVETGMLADLVLLRGNPLVSIELTREIEMVFAGGQGFDRARLDGLLESVRRDFDRLGGSPAGAD